MDAFFSVIVIGVVVVVMAAIALKAYGGGAQTRFSGFGINLARRRRLLDLREHDPNFSLVLFEEYLLALYVEAHQRRVNEQNLARLSPYLQGSARDTLRTAPPAMRVKGVLVGELQLREVEFSGERVRVSVALQGAHVLETRQGEQTWFSEEVWTLTRSLGAQSRPPARVQVFDCPKCGAKLDLMVDARCQHCDTVVDTGTHDWVVEALQFESWTQESARLVLGRMSEGVMIASDPAFDATKRLTAIQERDPGVSLEGLRNRVGTIFSSLQDAWEKEEWHGARPYVTDRILEHELFWIRAHHQRGERGAIIDQRLTSVDLIDVLSDRWFDAVTFRIWCSKVMLGAGLEGHGAKAHSEYWTLIRGTAALGSPSDGECPSCGAPIDVVRSGACAHCDAHVTLGEFDWVLSRIEDPEVYAPET